MFFQLPQPYILDVHWISLFIPSVSYVIIPHSTTAVVLHWQYKATVNLAKLDTYFSFFRLLKSGVKKMGTNLWVTHNILLSFWCQVNLKRSLWRDKKGYSGGEWVTCCMKALGEKISALSQEQLSLETFWI